MTNGQMGKFIPAKTPPHTHIPATKTVEGLSLLAIKRERERLVPNKHSISNFN
jgi:hypothetical protein